jgi:hypothetical protein
MITFDHPALIQNINHALALSVAAWTDTPKRHQVLSRMDGML